MARNCDYRPVFPDTLLPYGFVASPYCCVLKRRIMCHVNFSLFEDGTHEVGRLEASVNRDKSIASNHTTGNPRPTRFTGSNFVFNPNFELTKFDEDTCQ